MAGEQIVANLAEHGFNVIVKLHALSLDSLPKHSGGVDWQTRMRQLSRPAAWRMWTTRISARSWRSATRLLQITALSDSNIACLTAQSSCSTRRISRGVAKINPMQIERLRSVSRVVRAAADVGPAVKDELLVSHRRSAERAALAARMFYQPGSATPRAIRILYDPLRLEMPESLSIADGAATARCVATAPDS